MDQFQKVQIVTINEDRIGQRLDNFLCKLATGVPKSRIYRAIRKGEVRVNKKRAKAEYKLELHDEIRIPPLKINEQTTASISANTKQMLLSNILYENDDLLVINKLAGLPVHGGSGTTFSLINSLRQLKDEYHQLELVHRLDKETSGCLLLAKNRQSLLFLQEQIKQQMMEKDYYCLVAGKWSDNNKHVKAPLRKNVMRSGERMVQVDESGKPSHTEFECQQQFSNAALLRARLHTGRTHQIRAHLQYVSHPLAGDKKYGDRDFNKQMRELGLQRMFLHAASLKFYLPDQQKAITVTAPLDDELTQCLQKLALTAK